MDYKLEYLERLFDKIKTKRTESYVISRIWHQLSDDRVKFVIQQYVKRPEGNYALTDLYLPQINMFVEVNEPFHEKQILKDSSRNREILDITQATIRVVDCNCSLDEIHRQITEIVVLIKEKIEELETRFEPWDDVSKLSVEYHKKKGELLVEDNECFRTIEDIADTFGTKVKYRGFLRASGAKIPNREKEILWWPNANHRLWDNKLSEDGLFIEEAPKQINKSITLEQHLKHWLNALGETRITFLRKTDDLGFCFYRFVGVFSLDKELSRVAQKCVWRKISDRYTLG